MFFASYEVLCETKLTFSEGKGTGQGMCNALFFYVLMMNLVFKNVIGKGKSAGC